MRVLLDSNVWLAILTTDGFCRSVWRRARARCSICICQEVLDEVEEKLRTKFGFSRRHARVMTFFVQRQTEIVRVTSVAKACRDEDDNRIVAASVDGGCSHLVTGDADLLVLKEFGGVSMVSPREFMGLISP